MLIYLLNSHSVRFELLNIEPTNTAPCANFGDLEYKDQIKLLLRSICGVLHQLAKLLEI
jgi:hypothetical protein